MFISERLTIYQNVSKHIRIYQNKSDYIIFSFFGTKLEMWVHFVSFYLKCPNSGLTWSSLPETESKDLHHLQQIGPSGLHVPVLRSGHSTWHYFSSSLFRGPYFSTRKKAARVSKFCMGSWFTKIGRFQSKTIEKVGVLLWLRSWISTTRLFKDWGDAQKWFCRHVRRKIPAHADGGTSRGSRMRRLETRAPISMSRNLQIHLF